MMNCRHLAPLLVGLWIAGASTSRAEVIFELSFENSFLTADGEPPVSADGVSFVPGVLGTGAFVDIGSELRYASAGNIHHAAGTLEFWIIVPDFADDLTHHFLTWGLDNGMEFSKDGANHVRGIFRRFGEGPEGPEAGAFATPYNVIDEGWQTGDIRYLVYTWDDTSKVMAFYVDGQLARTDTFTGPLPVISDAVFQIGGDNGPGNLGAVIDELRIHNVALTEGEIAQRYDDVISLLVVPEPSGMTLALAAIALSGAVALLRRRRTCRGGFTRVTTIGMLLSPWALAGDALAEIIPLDARPNGVTHADGITLVTANTVNPFSGDPQAQLANDARLYAIADGSVSFESLAGLGELTYVNSISVNGQWVAGYSRSPDLDPFHTQAVVWSSAQPQNPVGLGLHPPYDAESRSYGVSNDGVAVGYVSDGVETRGFWWSSTNGIELLNTSETGANAISADGATIVGNTAGWTATGGLITPLEDPFQLGIATFGISPDGRFASGLAIASSPTFLLQAALWNLADGSITLLTDQHGDPISGLAYAVDNSGFAAGASFDGNAFVYDPLVGFAEDFEQWAFREYGDVFPTSIVTVNDMFNDGKNRYFALGGADPDNGYLYVAPIIPVPEPPSLMLALVALACCPLVRRR